MNPRTNPTIPILFAIALALVASVSAKSNFLLAEGAHRLHLRTEITLPNDTTGVAWSADGHVLATYSDYGQRIDTWRDSGAHLTSMHRAGFDIPYVESSIAFVDDGELLLTPPEGREQQAADASMSMWDVRRTAVIRFIKGPAVGAGWNANVAHWFAVSADKTTAVALTLSADQSVSSYSTKTWTLNAPPIVLAERAASIALSPDGNLLAIGTVKGKVEILQAKSLTSVREIEAYGRGLGMSVQTIAFSPDGSMIVTGSGASTNGSTDATPVRIWRVADGASIGTFSGVGLQPIRSVAWRSRGNSIAFSAADNRVRIWDHIKGHTSSTPLPGTIMSVSFSPDGERLAICNANRISILELNDSEDK